MSEDFDPRRAVREQDLEALAAWLERTPALEVSEELARMPPDERAVAFRLLDKPRALEVFESLDTIHQQELLDGLRDDHVGELVQGMEPDDRARLLDEVPAKVAARLQAGLTPEEQTRTAILLGYPPESAGRVMTPNTVSLRTTMTAEEALAKVRRRASDADTLYALPVTNESRELVGMVDLRELVVAGPSRSVGGLVRESLHKVSVDTDQEVAARLIQEADLVVLPVVDTEGRLVGVITVDDAMEIIEAEDTEDIHRAGGSEPLGRPYLAASPVFLARKRAAWLLILVIAAALTVNVMEFFEETLNAVITLSLFIPLLIDAGGNSGSQAATVVIRAMAVGEVRFRDLPSVAWRELRVGVLLGLMLAAVALPAVTVFFDRDIAVVVSVSLVTICIWATFAGSLLPLAANRLGFDPAVVSAPAITTFVDATGLIIYFLVARVLLTDQVEQVASASPALLGG